MIWTNEVFKIFGITTEKVVTPKLGLQYYHEDDRPKIKEAFMKVKNDISELRADVMKLADRVNNLAIELRDFKKKKKR